MFGDFKIGLLGFIFLSSCLLHSTLVHGTNNILISQNDYNYRESKDYSYYSSKKKSRRKRIKRNRNNHKEENKKVVIFKIKSESSPVIA